MRGAVLHLCLLRTDPQGRQRPDCLFPAPHLCQHNLAGTQPEKAMWTKTSCLQFLPLQHLTGIRACCLISCRVQH